MASTFSELKFELIGTGDQAGNWGETTNENIGTAIEQAITGLGNPVFTADSNLTLTLTNTVALQTARALVLNVTSTVSLTVTRDLVVPTIQKQYIVQNNTTGGQSIAVRTSAGTGITVPAGGRAHLYVDGVNVVSAVSYLSSLSLGTALSIADGGTGQTTRQAALDALAGSTTSGQYLRGNGTDVVMSAIQAGDISSVALTTGTITSPPTNNTDIVNKQYADAIATGINFHQAVEYATTAALPVVTYNNGTGGVGATLTANANGALTIDGYTFVSPADNGTRVLIKNQANGAQNGVYTLTQAGNSSPGAPFILTRATDFDSTGTGVDQIDEGDFFLVTSGTANVNTAWVQQTPLPITIGTTAIVFQQFSAPITYTAGTGLSESPTYTFNIANVGTAGTYGSASSVPVLTTNAQGQVTGVTNTAISLPNSATTATNANTSNAIVARDASGNFSAGTITATLSGNATNVSGVVAVANGGTGTATPSLVAGSNITISGTFPNQTINSTGGGGGASGILLENEQTITANFTVGAGKNALSVGPVTINTGISVTLGTGQKWLVLN